MAISFKQAKRRNVWLKVLLQGPSGSGKSFSALRVATGLAKKVGGRIAYIGTEGSRNSYYADEFEYDLLELDEPFTIDKYTEAIDAAIDAGYKILIIDSLTHEWVWLNDVHDKMPGNSFQNWGKLKPKHHAFMDKVLTSPIHVIATARGKDAWTMEDKNGKQVPKKVGMGAQQDKDISYEYTVSLMLEQDTHIAAADKDNTHLFDGRYEILTEKDGERLYEWANKGDGPAPQPKPKKTQAVVADGELGELQKSIIAICNEMHGTKNPMLMSTIKRWEPSCNPYKITDINVARGLYDAIKSLQEAGGAGEDYE